MRQRLDIFLGLVVEIGDGELRAERAESLGAAPGDRVLVGDADDQTFLAFEQLRFHRREFRRRLDGFDIEHGLSLQETARDFMSLRNAWPPSAASFT